MTKKEKIQKAINELENNIYPDIHLVIKILKELLDE